LGIREGTEHGHGQISRSAGGNRSEGASTGAGLESLEGKVIGIIDNGQANSTTMFQELAKLLREKFHTKEVVFKTKPTHMQGAPPSVMEEILGRCDAVVTGLGA
jgi:hypothetical protein